ncbi:MAG: hypothetical protein Q9165_006467 [Trypethelium subeluteriae]
MTKLFFLGATGHIGGATVAAILAQFPNVEIVTLIRDPEKARRLEQSLQGTRAIIGDLNSVALIERESKAAGIVINTAPDQLDGSSAAIEAVCQGLASNSEGGFYIHTSGAFLIGEEANGEVASEKVWSDVADIEELTSMPPTHYHQSGDQLVRNHSTHVNVAIVAPTVVYGLSMSRENRAPLTTRDIVNTAKELSAGFTMSTGRNVLGYVHVNDLADIYVRLFADAVKGIVNSDTRLWGSNAYYFANDEELTFAEYMTALVRVLKWKGVISTDVIKKIGPESVVSELNLVRRTAATHGYGANVRCRSERAKILLGWVPRERNVQETLAGVIEYLLSSDLR